MSTVRPFRALRPLPPQAADVSAVPYDVVNTEEARQLAGDNPLSFLRVSRPEIEMPEGTDIYSDAVYAKAAENLDRLIASAPMIIEDEPSFYIYALKMGERVQTGLVACCSVDEYDNDIIVVDCGFLFPGSDYPGINYITPDITYLLENKHKVRAWVFTHGHLDHIADAGRGAVPFKQGGDGRREPGVIPRPLDAQPLPERIGGGDALALAIAGRADPRDDAGTRRPVIGAFARLIW